MKKIIKVLSVVMITITLFGCASAFENAQKAVDEYNQEAKTYMESITAYNESAKALNANIQEITAEVDAAQETINKNEEALDPETLTSLKEVMTSVQDKIVAEVQVLPEYEQIIITESMSDDELKTVTQKVKDDVSAMKEVVIPESVEIIDYSNDLTTLSEAHQKYKDSIQSLKQITAPTDEFVMDRLKRIDNITSIAAVTEDHDPNGQLNKAGGYIGTIYYTDTQVDRSKLYIEEGKDNVIDVGTDGGGAIEIYPNADDAKKRDAYLAGFDGGLFSSGAHAVYGTLVVRVSNELTATQQKEMTQKLVEVLTQIDK